jgi:K+-sensing histidine kinase KdpD
METGTRFASPDRSSREETLASLAIISAHEFLGEIFGAINIIGAILDKNRQVVYANDQFLQVMGYESVESLLGKRPGEAISCIHSADEPAGCGTSEACSVCGAVNSIIMSQLTLSKVSRETRITSNANGNIKNWDLKVTCSPVTLSGERFYIFTVEDISIEKQKLALERIFFHDILNLAGGLSGLLMIMKGEKDTETLYSLIEKSEEASLNLIEEINLQRQLRDAEIGELKTFLHQINSGDFINSVVHRIKFHEAAAGKQILIDSSFCEISFISDSILLQRVLINMLKNALEASGKGQNVTIGCSQSENGIRLFVHNEGEIPRDAKLQIFQRSFSTKGGGRGMGTYSIKLLTEKYLNGKAGFISNEKDGTVFFVDLGSAKHD